MTETLCNSGSVKLAAGVDATELTAAQYTELINQAEGKICAECRVNFIESYSSLNDDFKKILEMACASLAALGAIQYDLGAYPTRSRAQTLLNVNYAKHTDAMEILKEKVTTDWMLEN